MSLFVITVLLGFGVLFWITHVQAKDIEDLRRQNLDLLTQKLNERLREAGLPEVD